MGDFFGMIWARILDFWEAVRDLFKNLYDDFKESNRFFKIKVSLFAAYSCIAVATILIFPPPGELNEIDARLRVSKTEIVGGRYFLVVNEGPEAWKNVVLTMNGRFTSRWPALRPGKKKAFFFNKFKDETGRPPEEDVRVSLLRIECSEGAFERDFRKGS